jgi:NMD protein affecting ribosome stability and mRNA decay
VSVAIRRRPVLCHWSELRGYLIAHSSSLTTYHCSIDITEGIPKQAQINFCKGCSRFLSPPTQWVICELESRELLAICLRKLKGLSKVRLIDAGFIWTEPHSKRLRVKLTIQKEVSTTPLASRRYAGLT